MIRTLDLARFALAFLVLANSASSEEIVIDSEVTWTEGRTIGVDDRLVVAPGGKLTFDAPGGFLNVLGELRVTGQFGGELGGSELRILNGSLLIHEGASFDVVGFGALLNRSIVQNLGTTFVSGQIKNDMQGTFVNWGHLETRYGHILTIGALVNVGRVYLQAGSRPTLNPALTVGGSLQNSGSLFNSDRLIVRDGGELRSSGLIRLKQVPYGLPNLTILEIADGAVPAVFHGRLENYGATFQLNRDLELGPDAQISNWGEISTDRSNVEIFGDGAFESCPYATRAIDVAETVALTAPASCSGPDGDEDGVHDEVDEDPFLPGPGPFSGNFGDLGIGGIAGSAYTWGELRAPVGGRLRITKEVVRIPLLDEQHGIRIEGLPDGGLSRATVDVCGDSRLSVTPGDDLLLTCGSVEVQVFSGEAELEVTSDGGRSYAISIPAGYSAFFDPETDRWEADPGNPDVLVVTSEGAAFVLPPGGTLQSPQVATLDVKPGSSEARINPVSKGVIAVAILGAGELDVTTIDRSTLRFGPGAASSVHRAGGHLDDVDLDGIVDLLSHYRTADAGLSPGVTEVCLSGETLEGTTLQGCAPIEMKPSS